MKTSQYKIFLKNSHLCLKKNIGNDYYSFIQGLSGDGYKQIILPSNVLLDLMKNIFKTKKANIKDIDLLEDDDAYNDKIDKLILETLDDRDNFVELIEELRYLSSDQNIEIRKIRFSYRNDNKLIDISLSINGLIEVLYGESTEVEKQLDVMIEFIWNRMKSWL
ncbi:hypothetical protein V6S63_00135 [Lactococcus lactis]|uniref:hypothetical protein n=1 Tax=Lactococcus lactis TaxID=1358 RepID=UPI001F1113E6|nr:hypothetical protein [Lactococcus lactis]MCH5423565.1 hypothetical protein [Lactococcus lactis]MCT0030312.1 hypothetical protein [Lactococcus lactis subsp. lactis]MCT0058953.1 hypothetical protein [Lactococcus lactis subsp. lactis]MCT3089206.1 hypothetical protein [Lactococcus lactis]MDM7502779.1 hypothetical protein [Lactococcus lactis]